MIFCKSSKEVKKSIFKKKLEKYHKILKNRKFFRFLLFNLDNPFKSDDYYESETVTPKD